MGICQYPPCGNETEHRVTIGPGISIHACEGECAKRMAPRKMNKALVRRFRAAQEERQRRQEVQTANVRRAQASYAAYAQMFAMYGLGDLRDVKQPPLS